MPAVTSSKYLVTAGWEDVPHLSLADMKELLDSCPEHLKIPRSKGTPNIGEGAIYPYSWEDVSCDPFQIPAHYFMLYGLDVGWKKTAAIWGAHDRDSDIIYCWSEHYRGQAEPSIHAAAITARANWRLPGVIDTAAHARSQTDGNNLFDMYTDLGLDINNAQKAVESGLLNVQQRLVTGRLKFFNNLQAMKFEYGLYRRDEKGKIVKENDHLCDSLRYLCMSIQDARQRPVTYDPGQLQSTRNRSTGY